MSRQETVELSAKVLKEKVLQKRSEEKLTEIPTPICAARLENKLGCDGLQARTRFWLTRGECREIWRRGWGTGDNLGPEEKVGVVQLVRGGEQREGEIIRQNARRFCSLRSGRQKLDCETKEFQSCSASEQWQQVSAWNPAVAWSRGSIIVGWGGEAAWAKWASVLPRWVRTLCGPETCWSARWSSLSGGGRANPSSNLFRLRDFEYLKFQQKVAFCRSYQ